MPPPSRMECQTTRCPELATGPPAPHHQHCLPLFHAPLVFCCPLRPPRAQVAVGRPAPSPASQSPPLSVKRAIDQALCLRALWSFLGAAGAAPWCCPMSSLPQPPQRTSAHTLARGITAARRSAAASTASRSLGARCRAEGGHAIPSKQQQQQEEPRASERASSTEHWAAWGLLRARSSAQRPPEGPAARRGWLSSRAF